MAEVNWLTGETTGFTGSTGENHHWIIPAAPHFFCLLSRAASRRARQGHERRRPGGSAQGVFRKATNSWPMWHKLVGWIWKWMEMIYCPLMPSFLPFVLFRWHSNALFAPANQCPCVVQGNGFHGERLTAMAKGYPPKKMLIVPLKYMQRLP